MSLIEVEMTYEKLYNLYGNMKHDFPCSVSDDIYVKTPEGKYTKINKVVCKHNNEIIRLEFSDNDFFECSINHLFRDMNQNPVKAIDAVEIDSTNGNKCVSEKIPLGFETVYDISIDYPHWYISDDNSGIVHHNTFFILGIVRSFLESNPAARVIYFDTESAVTPEMLSDRGIDPNRVVISEPETIQAFRTKCIDVLDKYKERKGEFPLLLVLDSLGMMSTTKELEDSTAGSETRDMTKAQVIKATFRVLTLKLAKVKVPLILTNHVYDAVGCLTEDMTVHTTTGSKFIDEIKIGDEVMTLIGPKFVTEVFEYDSDEIYEIETESGQVIKCTPDHKFLLQNMEWKKAKDLTTDDRIICCY